MGQPRHQRRQRRRVRRALVPNNYTLHQSGPSAASGAYGRLRFTSQSGLVGDSNTPIPLREWHHVAASWDGGTLRFYLDGGADGEFSFSGTLITNDEPLNLGADFPGGDEYWHGRTDDIAIFNRALSSADSQAVRNESFSSLASALVGLWRCNEGSGSVAHDHSQYRNHGRLMGDAAFVAPNLSKPTPEAATASQPEDLALLSNYPNPFNPSTTITYSLPAETHVRLEAWNALGQRVAELINAKQAAGEHSLVFNAEGLPSGFYLDRLQAGARLAQKRMLLVK